jgi:hypothetical protein
VPKSKSDTNPHKGIIATVNKRKPHNKIKHIFFDTDIQSEVENAMIDLGYGSNQYTLGFLIINSPIVLWL